MNPQQKSSFEILSCNPLFRMIIDLKIDEQTVQIPVSIDFINRKIYFEDNFSLNVDYKSLEFEIFEKLQQKTLDPPVLDDSILSQIDDVRNGNYGYGDFEIQE